MQLAQLVASLPPEAKEGFSVSHLISITKMLFSSKQPGFGSSKSESGTKHTQHGGLLQGLPSHTNALRFPDHCFFYCFKMVVTMFLIKNGMGVYYRNFENLDKLCEWIVWSVFYLFTQRVFIGRLLCARHKVRCHKSRIARPSGKTLIKK